MADLVKAVCRTAYPDGFIKTYRYGKALLKERGLKKFDVWKRYYRIKYKINIDRYDDF